MITEIASYNCFKCNKQFNYIVGGYAPSDVAAVYVFYDASNIKRVLCYLCGKTYCTTFRKTAKYTKELAVEILANDKKLEKEKAEKKLKDAEISAKNYEIARIEQDERRKRELEDRLHITPEDFEILNFSRNNVFCRILYHFLGRNK